MDKSITVQSDNEGLNVAMRSALTPDLDGNSRVVEVFDLATKKIFLDEYRVVAAADAVDLANIGSVVNNPVQAGDMSTLVVQPTHSVNDGSVIITPLILRSDYYLEKTVSINPTVDANDGYYQESDDLFDNTSDIAFGQDAEGNRTWAYFYFSASIPKFANVTNAVMTLKRNYAGNTTPDSNKLHVDPNLRSVVPASAGDMQDLIATLGSNSPLGSGVAWDPGVWADDGYKTTPSMAEMVQKLVNNTDWIGLANNSHLQIVIEGGNVASGELVKVYDTSSFYDPQLQIAYNWLGCNTSNYEVEGMLQSKSSAMGDAKFLKGSEYYSPVMAWDLMGGKLVGLHVTTIGGAGNSVKLYAGVI